MSALVVGLGGLVAPSDLYLFGALFGGSSQDDDGDGGSPWGGLLAALVAPLAATLVQLGISRAREYLADATGAEISADPEALARALVKLQQASEVVPIAQGAPATASLFIVNPFGAAEAAARWFSTHPSTADRVRRLREMVRFQRRPSLTRRGHPVFNPR